MLALTASHDHRGMPSTFPSGWFQVAWAAELEPGAVRPMRYFGRDLVVTRSGRGHYAVLDAHCPHRGAHLGHGGRLDGDRVVCPMHGWSWGQDGQGIGPDGRPGASSVRLRRWPTVVVSGLVLVWHDDAGRPPGWYPPQLLEDSDERYYPMWPHAARASTVHYPPQLPLENVADLAHVKYVHRWPQVPVLDAFGSEGPMFRNGYHGPMATPKGTVTVTITNHCWGIGLLYSWFEGLVATAQVVATTPIDLEYSEMRHSVWAAREPGDTGDTPRGVAQAVIAAQFNEGLADDYGDKRIWEHMRYIDPPALAREEAKMFAALKRWSRGFYPRPAGRDGNSEY